MSDKGDKGDGSSTQNRTEGGGDTKPVYAVWHGYDVVLTDNCHPSETRRKDSSPPEEEKDNASASQTSSNKPIVRRKSSDQLNDYGWLRQLDLRSDIPSITEVLDWSFDVLRFEETVLIQVFISLLEYYNLLEKFHLDRTLLERYCKEVMNMHHKDCHYQKIDIKKEGGVIVKEGEDKPDILCEYHNWYHAISCAHTSFLFLALGGADAFLNPIDLFCILMSALIHDLDHPGTNSDFEVKRSSSLAKLYDNDAVLERHSINMGLSLCQQNPDLNWLKSFNKNDQEYVKDFITEAVLATDPGRHGGIVKDALAFVEEGPQDYQQTSTSPQGESKESDVQCSSSSSTYFDINNQTHRIFIGRLILHAADISNPIQNSFEVAADWGIRVTTEFSRQAKKEEELQLPVTEFMAGLDSQYKIAKLQIGFFNFMVKPLFHTIGILFPKLKMLEEWGEKNSVEYQAVIDAVDLEQKIEKGQMESASLQDKKEEGLDDSVYKKVKKNESSF